MSFPTYLDVDLCHDDDLCYDLCAICLCCGFCNPFVFYFCRGCQIFCVCPSPDPVREPSLDRDLASALVPDRALCSCPYDLRQICKEIRSNESMILVVLTARLDLHALHIRFTVLSFI